MNILSMLQGFLSCPRPNKVVVITINAKVKYENGYDLDLTMMTIAATKITISMMAMTMVTLMTLVTMTMMKLVCLVL